MEGRNLRDTIASAFSNLVAVVTTQSNVKLDVDVIAAFALGSQLAASSFDKGECATVMVWCVVAASHEDDYISASCVKLRGTVWAAASAEKAPRVRALRMLNDMIKY